MPIVIIVTATAFKDAFEDWRRHAMDASVNSSLTYRLTPFNNTNFAPPKRSIGERILEYLKSNIFSRIFALIKILFTKKTKTSRVSLSVPMKNPQKIYYNDYCDAKALENDELMNKNTEKSVWEATHWKDIRGM